MRVAARVAFVLLLVCIASALATASALAQSNPSDPTIRGVVVDPLGGVVVGARAEASSPSEPQPVSTVTDQNGAFTLHVRIGRYDLQITAPGFQVLHQSVTPTSTTAKPTEFVLQVPGVRESVTVTAGGGGYQVPAIRTATKTPTPLVDVPQSVTVVTSELIKDQMMMSVGDVMRYVPGVMVHQGENNRDQIIVRGNSSSADFFVDGIRDDVQYYRDLYNLERVEALKGPNAMIFGRGGAGGVVNRVSKVAEFAGSRELTFQAGMFDNRRMTAGFNQRLNDSVALRLDGMFENSNSFRDYVSLERGGITPTATILAGRDTTITLRYEYLKDTRTADRGITSYRGQPADVERGTYYGNPDLSHVDAAVNVASGTIEHRAGQYTIRNQTSIGNYDRAYQNFVPGAATADGTQVALTAYNNATDRTNFFNQTNITANVWTGRLRHTILVGGEVGLQLTDNFRNTGFFNNTATSTVVPFASPTIFTPVTFRQTATDADNHLDTNLAAAYAQDQLALSRHLQVVGGLRFDRFDLTYHNNRNGDTLTRPDNLVSPRAGVVYKPIAPISIYSSYSVSYLPSSGDQFSSLTVVTEQMKPEQFRNYEVGAKWDARPNLSLTSAVYRLDRTNTRSTDPNDPTRIVQTGSQRTNGFEVGINGRVTPLWTIAGGYSYMDASVTSATTAAAAGAQVGQVPHHTLSFWNNVQLHPRLAAALGVLRRSDMFATIDNTVVLPGYTRVDAAGFVTLARQLRLQVNVENLFDTTYYLNADSNTNISFGFPRAVRVGLTAGF
jgi:catecholate siderophore receptor